MNGFGQNKYSLLKSKPTLIIFALLAASGIGSQFVNVPFLSLFALPVDIIYGITGVGSILSNAAGSAAAMGGKLVFYYVSAVVIGFVVHKVVGGSNDPFG